MRALGVAGVDRMLAHDEPATDLAGEAADTSSLVGGDPMASAPAPSSTTVRASTVSTCARFVRERERERKKKARAQVTSAHTRTPPTAPPAIVATGLLGDAVVAAVAMDEDEGEEDAEDLDEVAEDAEEPLGADTTDGSGVGGEGGDGGGDGHGEREELDEELPHKLLPLMMLLAAYSSIVEGRHMRRSADELAITTQHK